MRDAGLPLRRGADARLHERGGAAADPRDARDAPLQPQPQRDLAQGRDLRQLPAPHSSSATTATATPWSPWSSRPAPPATPASAPASTATSRGAPSPPTDAPPAPGEPVPAPYEALAALERTLLERKRERPDGSYTVDLLDDPKLAAREGQGGGRRRSSRRSRASPRSGSPRRAPTSIYHLAVLLLSRGVSMAEVLQILNGRRGSRVSHGRAQPPPRAAGRSSPTSIAPASSPRTRT